MTDCATRLIEVLPEHHGNLFFWHWENRHLANRHRTVIWLNGGPGCSSLDGALMEVGPYRLKDKDTLKYNDGSWDEFANLLFVDNPVGTGYSYVDGDSYQHELPEMADTFVKFLEEYFRLFPEQEGNDVSHLAPTSALSLTSASSTLLANHTQVNIFRTSPELSWTATTRKRRKRSGI